MSMRHLVANFISYFLSDSTGTEFSVSRLNLITGGISTIL
jgi:hypothetical protein